MVMYLMAAIDAPSAKEVVIAEVGAASAFVGFVLVFLGILLTTYQTLLGTLSRDKLSQFKTAAWIAAAVTGLGLASVAISTLWLVHGGGHRFYVVTLVVFFVELLALTGTALYSTRLLLR
jgi:hypothetical protein